MSQESADLPHRWKFFRAGGFDQVLLDSGEDLLALSQLDKKLWSALSFPVKSVEFDARTLELIDSDGDGHIRVPEILGAIEWTGKCLTDPGILVDSSGGVPLSAINAATEEGERLLRAARTILANLGKPDAVCITVEDACSNEFNLANTRFNGDGVVAASTANDESIQRWISDIAGCMGSVPDRSGEEGINSDIAGRFASEAEAWLAWHDTRPDSGREVFSEEAILIYQKAKPKIEDYFLRCSMARYDSRAATLMNGAEETLRTLSVRDLSSAGDDIAALPLAEVSTSEALNLENGINPAWCDTIAGLRTTIIKPLVGDHPSLTGNKWNEIKSAMDVYELWLSGKPETTAVGLGADRLRQWWNDGVESELLSLIEQDLAFKPAFDAIVEVERLTRYCRNLLPLANNFVSFRDFYTGRGKAIFQAGTLFMDGRSFDLCITVTDVAKHAILANLSGIYLTYCDCVRGAERMTIAAAVTNGDSDQLITGRNGVFFDRRGLDWDATIVRIVDHPISLNQALWAPYKRIVRMVGEQMQKVAAARAKSTEEKTAADVIHAGSKKEDIKPAQQAFDIGKFAGIFAALGLAAGALATALASIVTGFLRLFWWQMPLAVLGVALLISGPSLVIAWFKLRQRNLGRLLDANGWAVNTRAKINIPFGASLTGVARLPEGTVQQLADQYAEKKGKWKLWLMVITLVIVICLLRYHDQFAAIFKLNH